LTVSIKFRKSVCIASQNSAARCLKDVDSANECLVEASFEGTRLDLETVFRAPGGLGTSGWTAYAAGNPVNYPVMTDGDEAIFGRLAIRPPTLIVDRSGRIAAIHAGSCRKDEFESDIGLVLQGR
jgi:hypothetical protein